MFKQGKLYRHQATLDVDMFVTGSVTEVNGRINCVFLFWNRHCKFFHVDPRTNDFVRHGASIPIEDLYLWKEVGRHE